eukprot:3162042-Pyramimonas_sp.AAC.1
MPAEGARGRCTRGLTGGPIVHGAAAIGVAARTSPTAAAHSLPPQLEVVEREGGRVQPAALLRGEVG